jgi:RDD family
MNEQNNVTTNGVKKEGYLRRKYGLYYPRVGATFLEMCLVALACIPGMAVFYGLAAIYFRLVLNSNIVLYAPVQFGMLAAGIIWPVYRIAKNKQMKGYAISKLKIVRTNGEELTSSRWAWRTITKLVLAPVIAILVLLYIVPLLATKGKRHIIDYLFDTKAVEV